MKLPFYYINKAEHDALYGLSDDVQLLYLYVLRCLMNPADFRMRGVTWAEITSFRETHGAPGIKAKRPSTSACRRQVDQLVKAGLLEVESLDRGLILFFPIAAESTSVYKKADRGSDTIPGSKTNRKADREADTLNKHQSEPINHLKTNVYDGVLERAERKAGLKADREADRETDRKADREADSSNNNLTLPYPTYSDSTRFSGVLDVDQWQAFFRELGAEPVAVKLPKCIALFEDWYRRGVTVEVVLRAVALGEERLGKPLADTPAYYRSMVDELVEESASALAKPSISHYGGLTLYSINGESAVVASSEQQAKEYYERHTSKPAMTIYPVPASEVLSLPDDAGERSLPVGEVVKLWAEMGKSVPGAVF